ncbi:putative reverse transcriptase domain-containing protein [Tanacetum coccineum]|uniref:Reverse transcriptase domain-containing protein n=1 Tax=Tanacetum coccineum TaxID=301880 RepID=A0ABQ5J9Y7_9ASTR
MANVIPLDHVDDLPVVEPNQPDVVPVIPEPVLVDEDEDPEEEEFEEEEEPQEEEDMNIDDEEDKNESELMFPYEKMDPLNPPSPASDSEPEDVIEVEDTIEPEDKTVPASVYEVGESSTATFLREDGDSLLPGFMWRDIDSLFGWFASIFRRLCGRETTHALVKKKGKAKDEFYGKLILDLGNEVRSSVEEGADAMENLVRKLGNAEERAECKKLKKELDESSLNNTLLRELCLKKDRMRLSMFQLKMRRVHHLSRRDPLVILSSLDSLVAPSIVIMHPKSAPMTQATIQRMIKESVDAAIAAERARQANVGNDARGSGPAKGQDTAPVVRECTFAGFMKCNPDNFHGTEGAVEFRIWFEKTKMTFRISECAEDKKVKFAAATLRGPALTWWNFKVSILGLDVANQMGWTEMKKLMTTEFCPAEELQRMENELWNLKVKEYNMVAYTQRFNELALMCPRIVEPKSVKIDAYIRGLSDNIKGEVTSSRPTNLNEVVRMAHNSGKTNHKDNSRQSSQNNQKQGNARAMTTAPNEGKVSSGSLPVCERCFTRHVGQCTIKCHKCGKIGHKARYYKEKNVATRANAQPIWTCYNCGEQGHTRNRCPKKVKQEEVGEARGRAYAIKDAEPQVLNVVTGTFLLNNRYASVLFDLGYDRSFMNTRFSSMLDIDLVKIDTSYEVELADGRVVSTNTVLKGYTLNLVNHLFEIDLMPINLGMFDVKIEMDWLVKHDAVIVYDEKVVHICNTPK